MSFTPSISRLDLNHILEHTRDLWNELREQRIFITGGTGFFGHWLMESFLWANEQFGLDAQAVVLTRSAEAFNRKAPHLAGHPSVTLIQGDVRSFTFPAGDFSHIIHAATDASAKLNAENPFLMLDTIIEGTRRTLDFATSCNAKKILYTSSGAVYGKQPANLTHIPENYPGAPDPLDAKSAYGQGKRLAEHLCTLHALKSTTEIKIARCFAFVGPYLPLDAHFAIGNFIRDGLKGGPIVIKGDGTPRRSYLYAADLAIWLWTILLKGKALHPYNVGSNEDFSILQIAKQVKKQLQSNIKINTLTKTSSNISIQRYVPNISRVANELDLQAVIDLPTSIKRTIRFLGAIQ